MNRGFKFLTPRGTTTWDDEEVVYPLPAPYEKWGPTLRHSCPAQPEPDVHSACGPGRFHLMRRLDNKYQKGPWWVWYAKYEKLIAEDEEKLGVDGVRLRHITPRHLFTMARIGMLKNISLQYLYLINADWRRGKFQLSDLSYTIMRGGDFQYADLDNAKLCDCDMRVCDFRYANLADVNMYYGNFSGCLFYKTNMDGVAGKHADYSCANFASIKIQRAVFIRSTFARATIEDVTFRECDLSKANFEDARLKNVKFIECQLRDASFRFALLMGVEFINCETSGLLIQDDGDVKFKPKKS